MLPLKSGAIRCELYLTGPGEVGGRGLTCPGFPPNGTSNLHLALFSGINVVFFVTAEKGFQENHGFANF